MEGPAGFQLAPSGGSGPQHILCCECGVAIEPNPAAMCVNCIRAHVDITEGIPKQAILYFCRSCERYLSPPSAWIACSLESRELLALCLKRLRGLGKVRLVDAGFIWTEPHSKRVKVKLTVQKEIFSGAILQQIFVVEYVVNNQMCDQCHRREANDSWNAVVQVRQKVRHKKTFFFLEQLIIKHSAHTQTIKIQAMNDGIDFFFASKSDAKRMLEFLQAVVPVRYKTSERLISHDIHTNSFNYKFTFSVEIVPICKDDIVCLSPQLARQCGNISPLLICDRVGTTLHFVDPFTLQHTEISADKYWRSPFNTICGYRQMTEFVVLDIDPLYGQDNARYLMADVVLARVSDFGVNDTQLFTKTHLGHILQPGDNVWGFDLHRSNVNDEYANKLDPARLPDVKPLRVSLTTFHHMNVSLIVALAHFLHDPITPLFYFPCAAHPISAHPVAVVDSCQEELL
eukprot:m.98544 g.98544  ORF g.98544 m.98544 type:complete len:457 (+) comp8864_c0_seq1:49-1419(+)